jgi:hypothetical protein
VIGGKSSPWDDRKVVREELAKIWQLGGADIIHAIINNIKK